MTSGRTSRDDRVISPSECSMSLIIRTDLEKTCIPRFYPIVFFNCFTQKRFPWRTSEGEFIRPTLQKQDRSRERESLSFKVIRWIAWSLPLDNKKYQMNDGLPLFFPNGTDLWLSDHMWGRSSHALERSSSSTIESIRHTEQRDRQRHHLSTDTDMSAAISTSAGINGCNEVEIPFFLDFCTHWDTLDNRLTVSTKNCARFEISPLR